LSYVLLSLTRYWNFSF